MLTSARGVNERRQVERAHARRAAAPPHRSGDRRHRFVSDRRTVDRRRREQLLGEQSGDAGIERNVDNSSLADLSAAGRTEQASAERAEGEVLDEYLPAQLGDDEIARIVAAGIEQTGASGMKAMGQVMKVVTPPSISWRTLVLFSASLNQRSSTTAPRDETKSRPYICRTRGSVNRQFEIVLIAI